MKRIKLAAVAAWVFVLSTAAMAQDSGKRPPSFEELDVHHDGLLTRSEIPKELHGLHDHFQEYDFNHDHRIDKAEYTTFLSSISNGTGDCTAEERKGSSECTPGVNNVTNIHQDRAPPPQMFANHQ
ncbi:EF-hand domain-containing protein [Dyella koreensis]|uniref:EF-hand domain-containing protein n=1 Tax=Dyella koreensis TaxID=311235 RepID=A0ABW8K2T4_9GAMM